MTIYEKLANAKQQIAETDMKKAGKKLLTFAGEACCNGYLAAAWKN